MARKNPDSKEIYDEWDRLVFKEPGWPIVDREPAPELLTDSKILFDRVYVDGKWVGPLADAELVATLAISLAQRQSRQADAVRLSELLFSHPEASKNRLETVQLNYAVALILSGNVTAGVAEFDDLLERAGPGRSRRTLVRFYVEMVLEESVDSDTPLPELRELVERVLSGWKGMVRRRELSEISENQSGTCRHSSIDSLIVRLKWHLQNE